MKLFWVLVKADGERGPSILSRFQTTEAWQNYIVKKDKRLQRVKLFFPAFIMEPFMSNMSTIKKQIQK